MKKIIFTGGSGRFGKVFKKFYLNKKNISYPSSKIFDVTNFNKMEKYIKKIKPKIIIHTAAISRPMDLHEKKIDVSINTNIIGTANIVILCQKYKIKLIYFSTNYVYPSKKGIIKNIIHCFQLIIMPGLTRRRMCGSNVKKFSYIKNLYD